MMVVSFVISVGQDGEQGSLASRIDLIDSIQKYCPLYRSTTWVQVSLQQTFQLGQEFF